MSQNSSQIAARQRKRKKGSRLSKVAATSKCSPRTSRRRKGDRAQRRAAVSSKRRRPSNINGTQRLRRIILVAVIVFSMLAIYPAVHDYYVAIRTHEDLEAYQSQLETSNTQLKSYISYLESTDGIEDEARKRGYVGSDETGVEVDGLDESDSSEEGSSAVANTDTSEVQQSLPWYKRLLDALFGYVSEVQ